MFSSGALVPVTEAMHNARVLGFEQRLIDGQWKL